ncbi:helix-turn-helix transcriptional regulator [Litoreibacter janthinus]|uniref:Transcriptional regulator, AlpA family n=1 Tax=Litoreibacter janthinus TaxID=670154 RepID=A0A1I6FS11_9RHOB|nr:AlpA family transcriptional regulator [Litoreibacter janthinus]SFR32721.1 transcriptional regulator, AlpA family [Litoreibacter janthinus]
MSNDQILRRPKVESIVGLSRSTIYELMAQGSFPRPIKLGPRAVGWRERDVLAWLAARPTADRNTQ